MTEKLVWHRIMEGDEDEIYSTPGGQDFRAEGGRSTLSSQLRHQGPALGMLLRRRWQGDGLGGGT